MHSLLFIEDDDQIRLALSMALEDEGYEVHQAANGASGLAAFEESDIDLVLLDLKLPDISGFEVCRSLRAKSIVPIIMVTAQTDTHDMVAGLEAGADDYVELRREQGVVVKAGKEVSLTKTEFRLLCEFADHIGSVLSRDQLLERVWGYEYLGDSRLVDAHVRRLRVKIEDQADDPKIILTARGLGYRLVA